MSLGRKFFFLILLLASIRPAAASEYPYLFVPIEETFDNIARQLNRLDFDNERQQVSTLQLDSLDQLARQSSNQQLQARALYWRVRCTQMSASPPQCIEMLEEALALSKDDCYDYDRALIRYQLAGNYERMGQYMKTYQLLSLAIPTLQQYNDDYFLGNAYLLMGQLFLDIEYSEPALEQITLSRQSYERAGYPLNRIYFFEAMARHDDSSLQLYRQAIATGGKDWAMSLQALTELSSLYLDRQMPDSSAVLCQQGYELLQQQAPDNFFFYCLLAASHVKVLYTQGHYEEALNRLQTLTPYIEQLTGERKLCDIYRYSWLVHDKMGHRDEAYHYLKLYQQEFERSEAERRQGDIPKAQAREAISRQKDHILLLQQEAQLSRGRFYTTLLVTSVILLICIVFAVYFFQRYRLRRQENRELQKSLEQETLISQLNRKNFEQDMKQKDCEISSSTLLLANKNEVLQQIHDITKQFSDQGSIPQEYVRQVNSVIGDSLRNDDEWSRFKLHFDSVHPDFFLKLKERSSELTENDLRLCAYIRIGMRAKQIAEMLSVSPDSVNTNRYRLRKKLALDKGQSLDDFIRQI